MEQHAPGDVRRAALGLRAKRRRNLGLACAVGAKRCRQSPERQRERHHKLLRNHLASSLQQCFGLVLLDHVVAPEMHPADITAALKKAGSSQTQVGRDLGVTQQTVWGVIDGRKKSQRVARHIARTIGVSIHALWPGRYMARRKS